MARRSKRVHLARWSKSATSRAIARKGAKANLAKFDAAPRCGAARKRDGEPCCNPAMKNGRCPLHGGKTPSGDQWHVVQYGDCSTPHGEAKFNRKLRDHQRYAEKRAARLAAMTPEQRAKHDAWHRSHARGAAVSRSADSERARRQAEARLLLAQAPCQRPTGPEFSRIETALAAARAKLACLEARAGKPNDKDGIFS